ncbi:MAG: hypothetical protein IKK11_06270, partial [Oscillospiraceae bacterium]|nr:hypothetical protein [Oscillospiraceae bacterium]
YVDSNLPAGTVAEQNPAGGTNEEIAVDTRITLGISRGPSDKSKSLTIDGLPTDTTQAYKVEVYLRPNDTFVTSITVNPGQSEVEVTVTGSGIQYYKIVIPGKSPVIKEVDFTK